MAPAQLAIITPTLRTKIFVFPKQLLNLDLAYLTRSGILPWDIQADLRLNRLSFLSVDPLVVFMPQICRLRSMCIQSHRCVLFSGIFALQLLLSWNPFKFLLCRDNNTTSYDIDSDDSYELK